MVARELFNPESSSISEEGLNVRRIYCGCVRRLNGEANYGKYVFPSYDGGVSASGRKYNKNVWDNLAKKFKAMQVDAMLYIEYVLSHYKMPKSPNEITNPDYLDGYRAYLKRQSQDDTWEYEDKQVERHLLILSSMYGEVDTVYKRVLNDDQIGASPLVRYAYAERHDLLSFVSDRTKGLAKRQFDQKKYFYQYFNSDKIPQTLYDKNGN